MSGSPVRHLGHLLSGAILLDFSSRCSRVGAVLVRQTSPFGVQRRFASRNVFLDGSRLPCCDSSSKPSFLLGSFCRRGDLLRLCTGQFLLLEATDGVAGGDSCQPLHSWAPRQVQRAPAGGHETKSRSWRPRIMTSLVNLHKLLSSAQLSWPLWHLIHLRRREAVLH